jgi:hypothetical protein
MGRGSEENMGGSGLLWRVAVVAVLALQSAPAPADSAKVADKMSAALGGTLDDGMITAGSHGKLDTSVPLRRGRSREYRGQLASNGAQMQLVTTTSLTPANSRLR